MKKWERQRLAKNTFIVRASIGYLRFMGESEGSGSNIVNGKINVSDEG